MSTPIKRSKPDSILTSTRNITTSAAKGIESGVLTISTGFEYLGQALNHSKNTSALENISELTETAGEVYATVNDQSSNFPEDDDFAELMGLAKIKVKKIFKEGLEA